MIYNLSQSYEKERFNTKIKQLLEKECKVELKVINPKRTLSQNAYMHVLFGLLSVEWGYTLAEAKELAKRECPFMTYEKNEHTFLTPTSSLDKVKMIDFITWMRNWSSQHGCYLPSSEEYIENRYYFEKIAEQNKYYL